MGHARENPPFCLRSGLSADVRRTSGGELMRNAKASLPCKNMELAVSAIQEGYHENILSFVYEFSKVYFLY